MIFDAIRKHTKIVIFIVVIAFGIGGAFMGLGGLFFGQSPQVFRSGGDQVLAVATVGGDNLLYQDLYNILYNYQQQYPRQLRGMDLLPFKYRILDAMIEDKIISQEAKRRNITVTISQEEVEEELETIISYYASSKEEFEEILALSQYSISQLKEEIRKGLTKEGISKALWDEVVASVKVEEDELASMLEEVRARHILIDSSLEGGEALAGDLRERLILGEDFASLAKEYSSCPSGADGGDLGFFKRGSMVAPFEEVAFSLAPGDISGVVETTFGYHIILLEEKKDFSSLDEEKREEILKELGQDKKDNTFTEWLNSQKHMTEIVINDPSIRAYKNQLEANLEQAIADYRLALEYDPDNAYLYGHLGKIYQQVGDHTNAIEAFSEAAELAPYDMQILFNLGKIYQKEGEREEALKVYQEIQEWAGQDLMLHYQLMDAYKELGEDEKVLALEEKIEEIREKQMADFLKQLEETGRKELQEELKLQIDEDREEVLPETQTD